ncbi:LOW QUALITY PROTEIN: leucine-rich repeat protein 1-like [Cyprinus carpio]|uniref:LOW QUALITY PROTEIN: leucine-rich repeat protein 1-like n=1 Tax=Cyprinus carpio TaxID=7962 RepID=A0A9Q9Y0S3_CYPCA|nr:LOW QUALITY PROTEIN: leucine-rich repeat protein 1-like [Cyprinus carpio]
MQLRCDVEVVSRWLPSVGVRSKGRSSRAVLSLGRLAERGVFLLICTARHRRGARYKLQQNIEKFFTRFVEEGKATVRLKEPAIDICLSKADISSLKSFLSAARLAHRGSDTDSLPLSALGPARTRDVEKPKKKLSILTKKDYPLTSSFPYSLEQLQVSYCRLTRVDLRMLSLRVLRRLDLSNNHIKKLPSTIGDLSCLAELILHNNQLESFGDGLCSSTLQTSLQHLDLSQNQLKVLPARFCQLQQLVNLKLDQNKLLWLPFHIGRLSKLRFLSAAHNQLTVLPASFRKLCLENLDLFGNRFAQASALEHTKRCTNMTLTFPLLLNRVPHGPHVVPLHLCHQLDFSKACDCGRVCVDSFIQTAVSINLHLVAHTVVLVDNMGGTEAPVQKHFCSLLCYCEFMDGCVQRDLR